MTHQTKERLLHHATISVFCKPHDNKELVLHGLDMISPVGTSVLLAQEKERDPERPNTVYYRMQDIELCVQTTPVDEGTLVIYVLFFKKMSALNQLCKRLRSCLTPDEYAEFSADPMRLLDTDGKLSMRLDKELLMQDKFSLTDDGNCYQVRASVAAYPRTPESVETVLRRILE